MLWLYWVFRHETCSVCKHQLVLLNTGWVTTQVNKLLLHLNVFLPTVLSLTLISLIKIQTAIIYIYIIYYINYCYIMKATSTDSCHLNNCNTIVFTIEKKFFQFCFNYLMETIAIRIFVWALQSVEEHVNMGHKPGKSPIQELSNAGWWPIWPQNSLMTETGTGILSVPGFWTGKKGLEPYRKENSLNWNPNETIN